MAFELEPIYDRKETGTVLGQRREAAVDCWFTSQGKGIPRLVRFRDEEGMLRTIRDFQVLFCERACYAGIPLHRYVCEGEIGENLRRFTLLFHPEDGIWLLVLSD